MRKYEKRPDWMHAANAFALMHGIELFHFTEDKIDFGDKSILGEFWDVEHACFVEKRTPFPDIIQDNRFKTSPKVRLRLRKSGVILTWTSLGGKIKIDKILRESSIKKYLIDTFNYDDINIADTIDQYKEVIIKPLDASLGAGVYKLSKSNNNSYIMHTNHEEKEIACEDFKEYDGLFRGKQYIVQEYVDSRTTSGNPFDIKVYLIRSGKDGSWKQLNPLPRLGSPLGVISNVAAGGNALHFLDKFLEEEFGENWLEVKQEMQELIEKLPEALQNGYTNPLNSLGLDIGFDKRTNKPKLFEVNGTINLTPYKMEMCAEQMHLYKQLYKEQQEKNLNTKPQNPINVGGNRLYVDCYYTHYESLKSSLKTLASLEKDSPNFKRILVLGDIAETGHHTYQDIGKLIIDSNIDILICCGVLAKNIAEIFKDSSTIKIFSTIDIEDTAKLLSQVLEPLDAVLFKGSLSGGLEIVADKVFGTNLFSKESEKFHKECIVSNGKEVFIYPEAGYCSINKYIGEEKSIVIPNTIEDFPVEIIGKEAFTKNENIRKITLASTLTRIDCRAFYKCVNLKRVELPHQITMIDSKAFSRCKNLKEIFIPSNILHIANNAFEKCPKLMIIGEQGSYAQTYAQINGIKFLTNRQFKKLELKRGLKRKLKSIIRP